MGLYVRNNRYYFKKQIDGQVYYRALNLKKGQEILLSGRLAQIEEEILAKHYGLPYYSREIITFDEYTEKYKDQKKHKGSLKADSLRLDIISEYWGDLPLQAIGKPHVQRLEQALFNRPVKAATVNKYFELLQHFFNLAIEDGYLRENPVRFYKPFAIDDNQERALSPDEISRILAAARRIQAEAKTYIHAVIYDMIVLSLNTGMRISEILKLRNSYINKGMILYPITETKSKRRLQNQKTKVRVIVLNDAAQAVINKQSSPDDYVFNLKRRDSTMIRKTIYRIRELSKVNDFHFHQLRHTVSTYLSSQLSLATAKTMLGHSDLKTTLRYTHPGIEEQRRAVAELGHMFQNLLVKSKKRKED